jgi:membrane-bound metal-dependent hydrolase YbcI (DUF457 family)
MSWSAHQFESYVLQKHFGEKIAISYLAIVVGDMIPDSFTKIWVYGFTIGDTHFGADDPAKFHRGWPGAGFTHSLLFGAVIATIVWLVGRPRPWAVPWAIGIVIGQWAHCLTDINDSRGTMLFFPFTTHNFSLGTWAYAAQVGKHEDAAAYFSSLGLAMDVLWLVILLLFARKVLTRHYFRTVIRPADAGIWNRLGRRIPEDGQVALYRGLFVFAVARMVSWTVWSHVLQGYEFDLGWTGPDWLHKVPPTHQTPAWLVGGALTVVACCALLWFLVLRHARLAPGGEPAPDYADASPIAARTASGQSVTTPSRRPSVSAGTALARHQE